MRRLAWLSPALIALLLVAFGPGPLEEAGPATDAVTDHAGDELQGSPPGSSGAVPEQVGEVVDGSREDAGQARRRAEQTAEQAESADPGADDAERGRPDSVLYLWAGDRGPREVGSPAAETKTFDTVDGKDFLAVVDADPDSPTYGKVLRTESVPTPPGTGNEPHHMQPFVPPGCDTVFAGGLFSDFWFSFDVANPLHPDHTGTIDPAQTWGTVPDAAFVLPNCQALATEMGGGPATGSYPAGPHGAVTRFNAEGTRVLGNQRADRMPQDTACNSQWRPVAEPGRTGGPYNRKFSEQDCLPSNPHGIWARPDLNTLVTSDYATPSQLVHVASPGSVISKMTVRHYDLNPACTGTSTPPPLTDCIGDPRVVLLPDGPRVEANEGHEENVGVMETSTTHPAGRLNPTGRTPQGHLPSRGAFAATMCGGALYYAPDITDRHPEWREVYDFTAAIGAADPGSEETAGCTGGGAVVPTPDNRYLVHSIIGREQHQTSGGIGEQPGKGSVPGMIVLLDIRELIRSGEDVACEIDSVSEIRGGGAESDCPRLADVHVTEDETAGGPHFFSFDFPNGGNRLAFFNYFVSETGVTGNLDVCMMTVRQGRLQPDARFPAAVDGQQPGRGCISFDRTDWPGDRGPGAGAGKPHYGLFRNTR